MHHVSKIAESAAKTPPRYENHSAGFRRSTYVDRATGSVHMGVGVCFLDARGSVEPHVHSFEESFFILEGSVIMLIGDRTFTVGPGHYGLISTGTRHGFRNAGAAPARWLEMQAPQPRPVKDGPADYGHDTFFVGGEVPPQAAPPSPDATLIGHFDENQLPRPGGTSQSAGGPSQMEGFNPISGVAIKMFVDRSFGAIHQSMFLIQYMPGAKIDPHDHTFEESYLIVGGRVKAVADGQTYDLGPGDVIWTSVGCVHTFENVGQEPVRWIETQAPLPPAKEVFRFEREWAHLTAAK